MKANSQGEIQFLRRRVRELEQKLAQENCKNHRDEGTPHPAPSLEEDTDRQFQILVQSSPLPIVVLTRNGEITLWNPAAERLFGWKAEEVLGGPLPFIPEEKRAEHHAMRERDLRGDALKDVEIRRVRKDGSFIDVRVSTAFLRDPTGAVIGIVSLYADLTEQKAAAQESETARRRMEQQWRLFDTALSHTPDHSYIFDREGRIVYANKVLLDLWQKSWDEVRNSTFAELGYPPEFAEKVQRQIQTVLETGKPLRDEVSLRSFTPNTRHYEYIFVPVFGTEGEMEAVAGSTRDITDRHGAQTALEKANKDLEEARQELARINADLEHFAYAAAHDLQEPLRMVSIFTQLLKRKYQDTLDEQGEQYISYAVDGAKRMEMLVRDLLAYTRTTMDEEDPKQPIKAEKVLEETLSILAPAIKQAGAIITRTVLPPVTMYETHLQQLFQNLIGNALKYRSKGVSRIHVAAREQESMWRFEVKDNGIGIEDQYREHIFGLFKRLHRREEYEGTGIGLAICQKIVQRYGGHIWVESQPGEGSTFFFTVPRS